MADDVAPRSSHILQPRATKVLRAGPAPRGSLVDILLGVVGVLLLASTMYFAVALPHHDEPPVQYALAYKTTVGTLPGETFQFGAGPPSGQDADRRHNFFFDVPVDNVVEVTLQYHFTDDVAASLPDQFRMEVFDAESNIVGRLRVVRNDEPTPGADPTSYVATALQENFTWGTDPVPNDKIITGDKTTNVTLLLQKADEETHRSTMGKWKVAVVLTVGNCPTAQQVAGDVAGTQRMLACQVATGSADQAVGAQDRGNAFTIDAFSYRSFAPTIEVIE